MGTLITLDERELERRIRRIVRSEMAAGLKFVPSAANDDLEVEEEDDDSEEEEVAPSGVARRKKKRRAKKKKTAKAVASVGKKTKKKAKKKKKRSSGGKKAAATATSNLEQIYALLMAQGAMRVAQITDITGIGQSTVNRHLNTMMKQRRVSRLSNGNKVIYKATHDGRIGRKTAEKPNSQKRESTVPPPSAVKPIAA